MCVCVCVVCVCVRGMGVCVCKGTVGGCVAVNHVLCELKTELQSVAELAGMKF